MTQPERDDDWTTGSKSERIQWWTQLSREQRERTWESASVAEKEALREVLSDKKIEALEQRVEHDRSSGDRSPYNFARQSIQERYAGFRVWMRSTQDDGTKRRFTVVAVGIITGALSFRDTLTIESGLVAGVTGVVTIVAALYVISVLCVSWGDPDRSSITNQGYRFVEAVFILTATLGIALLTILTAASYVL
jgi:hypothetical protein